MSRSDIAAAMLARHVMTPIDDAVVFNASDHCQDVADALSDRDFDNAPIIDADGVIGYANGVDARGCAGTVVQSCLSPLSASNVVGVDTPLSQLLERFPFNDFLLVVGSSGVVGLVTPSDFNKQAGRACFYLLMSDLEIGLADCLRRRCSDQADLVKLLPRDRQNRLRYNLKRQARRDVAADVIAAMFFDDLLVIAKSTGLLTGLDVMLPDGDLHLDKELIQLRNDVMHLVKKMAADQRSSIVRLGELDRHLRRLLNEVETSSSPVRVDAAGLAPTHQADRDVEAPSTNHNYTGES